MAMGLYFLPRLFMGPIAGALADSWDRRKLLALAVSFLAAVTGVFALVVFLGSPAVWHMFAFIFAAGMSSAVVDTALMSMVPNIVPRKHLLNAFALMSLASSATRLAFPVVAGVLIAFLGPGYALLVAVGLLLSASAAAVSISPNPSNGRDLGPRAVVRQFAEGARYIKGEPSVLALVLIGAIPLLLIMPLISGLMPVFASEVFEVGPAGLGLLVSALGAGGTLGAFALASVGDVQRKGRILILTLATGIAATLAFSQSPSFMLSLPILALLGGSLMTFFAVKTAAVQSIVPDSLRGRVAASAGMGLAVFPIGSLLSGGLATVLGAPIATLIAALMTAALLAVLLLKFRQLWDLR
jgi:MFS family permease